MSVVPVAPRAGVLHPVALDAVELAPDSFWGSRQRTVAERTFPHIETWFARMGWLAKFATPLEGGLARGAEFSDSEVYKYLEALAWTSALDPEPAIERRIGELTELIAARQAPDGYIGTSFGHPGQSPRYYDLAFGHELYCAGHLIQAAVARGRTVGLGDPLVAVAVRLADHIVREFGPDGRDAVCGHPEIEVALAELARLVDDPRYLHQARLFVERRGRRSLPRSTRGWEYFSDDIPVRDADVLRGHAVRSLYLTAAAVDVAIDTGDAELLAVVGRQWTATLERRTYVTGGMGSRHLDEAFGDDHMLPPDRAYSETCAGIASIMVAWRLLLATGDASHADAIERALFNVVAAGYGEDGESFFYANTLHQRRRTVVPDPTSEQLDFGGLATRAPWYDVSCCLSSLARFIPQLGALAVTTKGSQVQVQQYLPGEYRVPVDGGLVRFTVEGAYPADGEVRVVVHDAPPSASLALRIPAWAGGGELRSGGTPRSVEPGYAGLPGPLRAGDAVTLRLPWAAEWIRPDARVDAVRGCRAVRVGPRVLCAEFLDDDPLDHDAFLIAPGAEPGLQADGRVALAVTPHAGETVIADRIELIPYHAWALRGPSTMRVWLPVSEESA